MDEVKLVVYDPRWPVLFADEAERLRQVIGSVRVAVEHVGSTSIPGLSAKPVIDILIGVASFVDSELAVTAFAALGYECCGENGIPGRLFFRKGLVQYRRTHHLHMVEMGHEQWASLLTFRDYLRVHPEERNCYEVLKHDLARQFRGNRKAYTEGKAEYISNVLQKARTRIQE